ncbi:MAG TPA: hypothetical protein VNE40_03705 [Candidatus Dormibacteraeota bacterium]|nr:hypothetical protein [Candidatus Dormibacteraeota bacterium]
MQTSIQQVKRKQGQQLLTHEKMSLTERIVEAMEQGTLSIHGLAIKLGVNTTTIKRYKPYADRIYNNVKLDRAFIRNLQINRTMRLIERLTIELDSCKTIREKTLLYNQLSKYYQHIALITGIVSDSHHTNINQKQLVIIRPALDKNEAV